MDFVVHTNLTPLPTIHVVSDSVGLTAQSLARAAAAQFGVTNPCIEVLPKVRKFDEVKRFLEDHMQLHRELKGFLESSSATPSSTRSCALAWPSSQPPSPTSSQST